MPGTSNFVARAADAANPSQTATQGFSITVASAGLAQLSISSVPDVVGGETFVVSAHLQDATAAPIPGAQISIDFAAKPCADATLGGTTLAVTNAAGDAQFSLAVDRGQVAYGLLATVVGNPLVTAIDELLPGPGVLRHREPVFGEEVAHDDQALRRQGARRGRVQRRGSPGQRRDL